MNSSSQPEITALTEQWRARAKRLMAEAEVAQRSAEIVRLTAMASTLEWAASDLSWFVRCPPPANLPLLANERSQTDPSS